ncbi:MAG: MgtC/SapB family protein [Patescibacteria group bacterium]
MEQSVLTQLIFSGQILLSIGLGAILGWQRARWGKSAGPRTYALVTAGSTLFTLLSRFGYDATMTSSANIAGQIVTGIGFLGVGLIFHRENHVDGLTTAAGLWASAAIGMSVGLSFYILAILTTTIFFFVLMMDEKKLSIIKSE